MDDRTSAASATVTTTAPARPIVELINVNKHFGDLHVLRDVDLAVDEREVVLLGDRPRQAERAGFFVDQRLREGVSPSELFFTLGLLAVDESEFA